MIWNLFRRTPTPEERILAASKWIDEDRARRVAAMNTPHSKAARKGWETRREARLRFEGKGA